MVPIDVLERCCCCCSCLFFQDLPASERALVLRVSVVDPRVASRPRTGVFVLLIFRIRVSSSPTVNELDVSVFYFSLPRVLLKTNAIEIRTFWCSEIFVFGVVEYEGGERRAYELNFVVGLFYTGQHDIHLSLFQSHNGKWMGQ